ncbi:MAG: DEAD/DEAH box helicase, partial [Candidatus Aenigmatarchaeota archaeon]
PTDIQEKVLPVALEGKDLVGQSMTGSGKTLAFAIPILEKMEHDAGIQALILAPTRELVMQIAYEMKKISKHIKVDICEVFGGVSINPQITKLKYADIVVGTPGRLMDHMQRGTIDFRFLKILVLDEADRMLDMGFIRDIRKIVRKLPEKRQTMLFSATIPDDVFRIARDYMKNPVKVVTKTDVPMDQLQQYYTDAKQDEKISLLIHLISKEKPTLALVFCATRDTTDFVANALVKNNIEARAIHGGLTQERRTNILEGFHRGRPHVLVATDVAARGLDIKNVTHIFQYDSPKTTDDYKHRIGRTARIGEKGKSLLLLTQRDHEFFRKIIRDLPHIKKLRMENFPKIKMHYHREREERRPQRYSRHKARFGSDRRRRY